MNKNIAFTHLLQPLMSTLTPLRRTIQHGACTQCKSHDLVSDLLRLDFGHGCLFLETLWDLHLGLQLSGVIGLRSMSVLLSVDAVHTRATCVSQQTMACGNCQWTMLDFSFMCGNVTTSAVVPGTCLFFLSSVAPNIRKVSYALSMMDAVLVGQLGFMSKG